MYSIQQFKNDNQGTLVMDNDAEKEYTWDMKDVSKIVVNSPSLGIHIVLIDTEDAELVEQHRGLYIRRAGQFIYARVRDGKTPLHRLVTNCPKGMVVDHINRNPLDNRKSNLRVCTIKENLRNQFRPDNTSGHRGVYRYGYDKSKYIVSIRCDYKQIHLGVFATIEEAIAARKAGELKYWGVSYDHTS